MSSASFSGYQHLQTGGVACQRFGKSKPRVSSQGFGSGT